MKVSQLTQSKYLKHTDIEQPMLLTVRGVKLEKLEYGGKQEQKGILYFHELEKGLVLNKTNLGICEKVFESDDTDEWTGQSIVLYVKDDIEYQGEIVSGLRLRAPKKGVAKVPVRQVVQETKTGTGFDDMADDVPF